MSVLSAPKPVHLSTVAKRGPWLQKWERHVRDSKYFHWVIECFAEMLGVFIFVYTGVGATVPAVLGHILTSEGLDGSLLSIGLAYAISIALAVIICAQTSGGHLAPSVTIVFVLFRGLPVGKAVRYILSQILGAYLATLLVYAQYHHLFIKADAVLSGLGVLEEVRYTAQGPAGVLAGYVQAGVGMGTVVLNEFMADFLIGLVVFSTMDGSNLLCPPVLGPWMIGLSYGVCIWSFSANGLAANSARDIGGRLAAMTIYGSKAMGSTYAIVSAFTNIPANILAALVVDMFLTDSDRVVTEAHMETFTSRRDRRRTGLYPNLEREMKDSANVCALELEGDMASPNPSKMA